MIDGRRNFLMKAAGALVALTGLALASPAIAGHDPIFAAIDAHREAVTTFNAMNAKMVGAPLPLQSAPEDLQAAFMAQLAAEKALIDTAPTTRPGMLALERHLQDDRTRGARWFINRTVSYGDVSDESPEAIAWLTAKRAAEINAAV